MSKIDMVANKNLDKVTDYVDDKQVNVQVMPPLLLSPARARTLRNFAFIEATERVELAGSRSSRPLFAPVSSLLQVMGANRLRATGGKCAEIECKIYNYSLHFSK